MCILFCFANYYWLFRSLWVPSLANKIYVMYFHNTIPLKGSVSLVSACDCSDLCGFSADFEWPEISEINRLTWSILSTLKLIFSGLSNLKWILAVNEINLLVLLIQTVHNYETIDINKNYLDFVPLGMFKSISLLLPKWN